MHKSPKVAQSLAYSKKLFFKVRENAKREGMEGPSHSESCRP